MKIEQSAFPLIKGGQGVVKRAEQSSIVNPLDEWWGEELFLFEKVPVRVCRDCGEVYIAADVAKRLEAEMQTKSHCYRQVSVPVVAYEEVAA